MKKIIIMLVTSLLIIMVTGCNDTVEEVDGLQVAVSVLPQKAFVQAIAGDLVDVEVMIPPGASPANYQPTPKALTQLSESTVYFAIGVPTEAVNIIPNMVSNTDAIIYHLDEIVDKVYPTRYFVEDEHDEEETSEEHEEHTGRDPHIWLSPKRVIIMVETIRDTLMDLDQENADTYFENAQAYIGQLEALDFEIRELLEGVEGKDFIIMHPSLGYFADDYGLHMVAIEEDGKEATAQGLQSVIDYAVDHDIHLVFYQAEFDASQAKTIADAIDGSVMEIETLSEDYINNMKKIAAIFSE